MIDKSCNHILPSSQKVIDKQEKIAFHTTQTNNIDKIKHESTSITTKNNNNIGNGNTSRHQNNNNNNTKTSNSNNINHNNNNTPTNLNNVNHVNNKQSQQPQQTPQVQQPQQPIHPYPSGPAIKLTEQELHPPTPSILVQTEDEVFSPQLQEFCLANPIVVIRNIAQVLNLNLGLFSTKTLVDADSDHQIEVRTQLQQPSDENWDTDKKRMIWRCESPRNFSNIAKYASYQASTFQEFLAKNDDKTTTKRRKLSSASHEEGVYSSNYKFNLNNNLFNGHTSVNYDYNIHCYDSSTSPASKGSSSELSPSHNNTSSRDHSDTESTGSHSKTISTSSSRIFRKLKKNAQFNVVTFGTNVDLSDSRKWKAQLDELDKLPMFSRVVSASNMLTHVGHSILGMNTVQLYMKVPGCRTPGHQENNNFCSVNINIGPGDCEWFGVPDEYWGPMAKLCAENNTNFVHGSWWPSIVDLEAYNIPVYRFIQKPGDLVWVNTGTVHWVQAIGWCNNIAWNVGPITSKQFRSAIERYEWNKAEKYKSIVPMIHLTWNLARNVEIQDEDLFQVIKNFMTKTLNFCERILAMLGTSNIEVKWHGKAEHEAAHYCATCELEVFNILFVKSIEKKLVVHCAKCAIDTSPILENFIVLQEYDMNYLKETYSNFIQSFKNQRTGSTFSHQDR